MTDNLNEKNEFAVLGGGCFWCIEAAFSHIQGIKEVISGYAGGKLENPTYEKVSNGKTGHAETVKIIFDKDQISYEEILLIFFEIHDPTTPDRQGNDIGSQYRSIILYASSKQQKIAQDLINKITKENVYKNPIITQIEQLKDFYPAEEYHQNYFQKNPDQAYCRLVIAPKISKLKEKYKNL